MTLSQSIYYIGNNPDTLQFLESSLEEQEALLELKDVNQLQEVNYLLAISPSKVKLGKKIYRWIDLSCLWENYLLERYPHIKLMIIGFWSCDRMNCDNYRDILDLGDWKDSLFSPNFPSLKEVYAEKEIANNRLNEWNVKRYLKRFVNGHNRLGFSKYLTALKHTMTVAYDEYKIDDYQIIEKEVIKVLGEKEWKHLSERWIFYRRFLEYTPFCQHVEKVNDILQEIHTYFSCVLKKSPDFTTNEALFGTSPRRFEIELDEIYKLLKYDLKPYI